MEISPLSASQPFTHKDKKYISIYLSQGRERDNGLHSNRAFPGSHEKSHKIILVT